MPSLLSLPREVRDEILEYALVISRPAPASPWSEPIRRRDIDPEPRDNPYPLRGGNLYSSRRTCYTKFETYVLSPMPTFLALLLSNKQLSEESRSVMRKFGHCDFELDVMFVNETETWPTWVWAVPSPEQHAVRRMSVSIRYFGAHSRGCRKRISDDGGPQDYLQPFGCAGVQYWVWAFYFMLERFLCCGPVGGHIKDEDKQWSIEELHLDVLDTPVMHDPSLEHDRMSSSWLALPLADALGLIIPLGGHGSDVFNELLYARVGRLKVTDGGIVIKDWNIGKELEALGQMQGVTFPPGSHLRGKTSEEMSTIKSAIARKKKAQARRARGLPME